MSSLTNGLCHLLQSLGVTRVGPEEELLALIFSDAKPKEVELFFERRGESLRADWVIPFRFKDGKVPADPTSYSLLMFAVTNYNDRAFELILDKCTAEDIMWRNSRGANIMQLLAKRGMIELAVRTHARLTKPDRRLQLINNQNSKGWTALHAALQNNRYEFAVWLVKHDADLTLAMNTGWTPFHAFIYQKGETLTDNDVDWIKKYCPDLDVKASHRRYGDNVSIEDLVEYGMAKRGESVAKAIIGKGLRTLVVLINFYKFDRDVPDRKGAEMDNEILDVFEECSDCEVMLKENLRKSDLADLMFEVQKRMKEEDFGLVFWIVSSHGGCDSNGQFFYASDGGKVDLNHDLIWKLSLGQCPWMAEKASVFFLSVCQRPELAAREYNSITKESHFNKAYPQGNCLVVYATPRGSLAMRCETEGSMAICALKAVLDSRLGSDQPPSVMCLLKEVNQLLQEMTLECDNKLLNQELAWDRLNAESFDKIYLKQKT